MTQQLTQEMADKYLKNPTECPFCGSDEDLNCPSGAGFDWDTESALMECGVCGGIWQDVYALTRIANEDFTKEFALRSGLQVRLEDNGAPDQECYLQIVLYAHGNPGEVESAILETCVSSTEDMTETEFEEIVSNAQRYAYAWGATLDIQVKKEDYFNDNS